MSDVDMIPTAHAVLVADPGYVGEHRRYNACLGCFDELDVLRRAANRDRDCWRARADALAMALRRIADRPSMEPTLHRYHAQLARLVMQHSEIANVALREYDEEAGR